MLFWGGLALLAAAVVAVALMPTPIAVDTAVVERGPMSVTLDHEGRTRVPERYVVLRIGLEPGDRVRAGETVVATFRPAAATMLDARTRAELAARVKAAEAGQMRARAERDRVETEAEFAISERDRARNLESMGLVTEQARQAAEAEAAARGRALEAAESAVTAAAADLAAARAALIEPGGGASGSGGPTLSLRSPIDGVVLRRVHESETTVPQGEPLLELGDTSSLEVVADYLSTDAVRIKAGMPALIEGWGGEGLRGRVERVEPSGFLKVSALGVEEQRVWVVIDFADPRAASEALGDGYRVEARVVVWEKDAVVTVPVSSLFRDGGQWAVFAVEGGRARARHVTVGQRNGVRAEIASGLQPGERVIVHPPDTVEDGARVAGRGDGN
jgi:HlyD family secretion protein